MTIEEAEILCKKTDYAIDAIEYEDNKINWADAAAFFLEGFEYYEQEQK